MSYQVLARKYRPRSFEELEGQEHVLRALVNALDQERLHHAFLFSGTRGVGKTTIARILAKALNCEQGVSSTPCGECSACREIDEGRFVDLIEVDAASRTRVDDTRELLDNVQYTPARGRYKVYIVDEVHMLSTHSFNALLKTLEEPPPHVKFLLATTDPQKLPVTVLSRCLQFNLKRLPASLIERQLNHVMKEEGLDGDAAAVALVARAADGSMRDGLSLLDQAIAFGGGRLGESEVRAMLGTVERDHVIRLLEALAEGDGAGLLQIVAELDESAPDYLGILDELASHLQRLAVLQIVPGAGEEWEDREKLEALAARMVAEDVQLYYQTAILGRRDLPLAPEPRAGLEMVLLRMLAFQPDTGTPAPSGGGDKPARAAARTGKGAQKPAPSETAQSEPPARETQGPAPQQEMQQPTGEADPVQEAAPVAPTDWNAVVASLGLKGLSAQLAANCALEGWSGEQLHLRMDRSHEHLRTEAAVQRLQKALSRFYGKDIKLRLELTDAVEPTPARHAEKKQEQEEQRAREAIATDPNVKALEETFGTRADMDSVRPRTAGNSS